MTESRPSTAQPWQAFSNRSESQISALHLSPLSQHREWQSTARNRQVRLDCQRQQRQAVGFAPPAQRRSSILQSDWICSSLTPCHAMCPLDCSLRQKLRHRHRFLAVHRTRDCRRRAVPAARIRVRHRSCDCARTRRFFPCIPLDQRRLKTTKTRLTRMHPCISPRQQVLLQPQAQTFHLLQRWTIMTVCWPEAVARCCWTICSWAR